MKLQNLKTPFVLMALNAVPHKEIDSTIPYPYKAVIGRFNGEPETSYLIPVERRMRERAAQIVELAGLAHRNGEQCILYVDEYGHVQLVYGDGGDVRDIGKWKPVSADVAHTLPDYTYDPETKTHWVAA